MKKGKRILAVLLCAIIAIGAFALVGCGGQTAKETYLIKYDLNYEGGETRNVSVQAGAKAVSWRATREGFDLGGWFTDADGTKPYDFTKPVTSDATLYAKWTVQPGMATVTFDFNVAGIADKTVAVRKTNAIARKYVPDYNPFGMKFVAWYADEAKTRAWNFDTDKVNDDITLYAGYEYTMAIPRNGDGSIAYDHVTINVWTASVDAAGLAALTEKFNKEYNGKISVNVSSNLASQADTFLRIQQIPGILSTTRTYYSVGEIYNFAGLAANNSNWLEKATAEARVNGAYTQVPLVGVAPYMIYNKSLLAKYSDGGALPTNYTGLSALLKAAYNGEVATNSRFRSVVAAYSDWSFKEAPSMVAFNQNGAPYYKYENGKYVNEWADEAVYAKAETALRRTYDLFGENGANHGGNANGIGSVVDSVKSGNALMGMVTWRGYEGSVLSDPNLGVIPLSGLFTDETGEGSKDIPIHTIGIGFCNLATNVVKDPLKVCASAVYSDWLSKHAYELSSLGYVPLATEAVNADAYVNSTDRIVSFVRSTYGDANNLTTLPGTANLKTLVNVTAAEGIIVPVLGGDGTNLTEKMHELYTQIGGLVY